MFIEPSRRGGNIIANRSLASPSRPPPVRGDEYPSVPVLSSRQQKIRPRLFPRRGLIFYDCGSLCRGGLFGFRLLLQKLEESQAHQRKRRQQIPDSILIAGGQTSRQGNVVIKDVDKIVLGLFHLGKWGIGI